MNQKNKYPAGVHHSFPSSYYIDESIFEREKEVIFEKSWHLIGNLSDFIDVADYLCELVCDKSIFLIKTSTGEIKAYHNVCQHRGHELLPNDSKGNAKKIICPYHSWTYNPDGDLIGLPQKNKFPGIDLKTYSLKIVQVEIFAGFVFVNLDLDAPSLLAVACEGLEEINKIVNSERKLFRSERTERLAEANWKVVMENFNECYHCQTVHKTLSKEVLSIKKYRTEKTSYGLRHESDAKGENDPNDKFFTWWFYPTFAIQCYPGGIINTYRWKAISKNRTKVEVDWWLPSEIPTSDEINVILQHRNFTFSEDAPIVNSVQKGLESGALERPTYVVDVDNSHNSEHPILAFHEHYLASIENRLSN